MKINKNNYISNIEKIGVENLPEEIKHAHLYIMKMTDEGTDWSLLKSNASFKSIAELAFTKLEEFLKHNKGLDGANDSPYIRQIKKDVKQYQWLDTEHLQRLYRLEIDALNEGDATPEESEIRMKALEKELKKRDKNWLAETKSAFNLEGVGKRKTSSTQNLLHDKELAILYPEMHLPKKKDEEIILAAAYDIIAYYLLTGQRDTLFNYGDDFELEEIVGGLDNGYLTINMINGRMLDDEVNIPTRPLYLEFGKKFDLKNYKFQVLTSVEELLPDKIKKQYALKKANTKVNIPLTEYLQEASYIKRFLELDGSEISRKELYDFITELQQDIRSLRIRKHSHLAPQINYIQESLLNLYNNVMKFNRASIKIYSSTKKKMLKAIKQSPLTFDISLLYTPLPEKIEPSDLQGIPSGKVLPSKELEKMEFVSIGFTGKWLELIGDPSAGFTAMIFGKPKMGKSYLAVDFAGYLARNFGKVLYVAKEEKFGVTLANKFKDKNAGHENLFISDTLPEDLSLYDFIFIDSINSLDLKPEDLRLLKEKNPQKSFVYIFQTTKNGNFRGENTFQHDVDIVIEIPERGKAVQYGRFNQGGEISIFEDEIYSDGELGSISSKKKKTYPTWTRPKHLLVSDHETLKRVYDYYKEGDMAMAMNIAMDSDTVVREEIPGDIWKKIGGRLTKTGEEKLKRKKKAVKPEEQKPAAKKILVFHGGVRTMKEVLERAWDLELTDSQYIEILDIAEDLDSRFVDMMDNLNHEFNEFFAIMKKAMSQWESKNGKLSQQNRGKFDPKHFANRSDAENPAFIFSSTSNRVLSEAINGDFDLIYMVRRELANRGLDRNGKWVGFDKAEKLHKI